MLSGTPAGRLVIYGMAAILAATVLVFSPTLDAGFLNLDDYRYVTALRPFGMATVSRALVVPYEGYQPLSLVSLGLTTEAFGFNPWLHHAISLLLHLANTLLVFVLVRRLTSSDRIGLLSAACFGLLPAQVEPVAWIASRKDVLYAFFYLLGLVCYVRYRERPAVGRYLSVAACFLLSALSKGMAVAFPLSLVVVDVCFRPPISVRRFVRDTIPFFLAAVLIGWLSVGAQQASGYAGRGIGIGSMVGRTGLALQALLAYAGHIVNPDVLAAYHPHPAHGAWACGVGIGALALAVWAAVAVWTWGRSRLAGFGLLFFIANLVLVLQFVPVAEFLVADRYLYVASLGFAVAFAALADVGLRQERLRRLVPACVGAVLFAWALSSWSYAREWGDSVSVWSRVLARHPDSAFALNLRAGAWLEHDATRSALADLDRAVAAQPGYSRSYLNRGVARERTGDDKGAMEDYNSFSAMQPCDPQGYNNRGLLLLRYGAERLAVSNLTAAVMLGNGHPRQHVFLANLAEARLRGGDAAGAVQAAEDAIRLHPRHYRAFLVLAEAAFQAGDRGRAEALLREAEAIDPADAAAAELRKRCGSGP